MPDAHEDEEQCVDCKTGLKENDRALQCDFCDNWYCFKCTKVSSKSYEALFKSQDEGLQWFDTHCRISFNGVTKIINKVSQLEKTQKEILADVQELKIRDAVQGVQKKEIESMIRDEMEEKKRIDERKLNVMFFGLAESKDMNIENRRQEDEHKLYGILKEVMGEEEEFGIAKITRIGRPIQNDDSEDEGPAELRQGAFGHSSSQSQSLLEGPASLNENMSEQEEEN